MEDGVTCAGLLDVPPAAHHVAVPRCHHHRRDRRRLRHDGDRPLDETFGPETVRGPEGGREAGKMVVKRAFGQEAARLPPEVSAEASICPSCESANAECDNFVTKYMFEFPGQEVEGTA